jgi:hypothetical protein
MDRFLTRAQVEKFILYLKLININEIEQSRNMAAARKNLISSVYDPTQTLEGNLSTYPDQKTWYFDFEWRGLEEYWQEFEQFRIK